MLAGADLVELVGRARQGDVSAKQMVARHHIALCRHLAKRFRESGYYDDILAAALIRLVSAINSFPGEPEDLPKWITKQVSFAIRNEYKFLVHRTVPRNYNVPRRFHNEGIRLFEFMERLERVISDDVDRALVNLKLQGKSGADISRLTGWAESTVSKRLKAMEDRFGE